MNVCEYVQQEKQRNKPAWKKWKKLANDIDIC